MPNIGTEIQKTYLARAFDLEKVKTSSAKNISKILDDLIKEITRQAEDVNVLGVKRTAYQQERLDKLFSMAKKTINSQFKDIAGQVRGELITLAEIEAIFAGKAINSIIQADVLDYVLSREVLEKLADETLIQGAPSADWWAAQSIDLQNEFKRSMRLSIAKGETLPQMAARLRGTQSPSLLGVTGKIPGVTDQDITNVTSLPGLTKKAKRNAEALVRSSYQGVMNAARQEMYQANSDVIAGVEYTAVLDSRTTIQCRAYDGSKWDLNHNPIQGTKLPYAQPPSLHWGCRSILVPIMKSLEDILGIPGIPEIPESTRSSFSKTGLSGQIPADTTFDGFMKSLSAEEGSKVLGKQRYQMWADGKITLADMINPRNNKVMTLKQLRDKTEQGRFWND